MTIHGHVTPRGQFLGFQFTVPQLAALPAQCFAKLRKIRKAQP